MGREIDAQIAEKVMGNRFDLTGRMFVTHENYKTLGVCRFDSDPRKVNPDWEPCGDAWATSALPKYSTDIAAAWAVVQKVGQPFMLLEDRYGGTYSGGNWVAYFGLNPSGAVDGAWSGDSEAKAYWCDPVPGVAVADTPAEAICRAALLAVGVTPKEEK